jgi:hypothetical protein
MPFTIIIPTLNKEIERSIKNRKYCEDDIISLRINSKNLSKILNQTILNAKNNDILLVNPRDSYVLKSNFLELFRKESSIVIDNLKPNGETGIKSSIKFSKKDFIEIQEKCKNLPEYIRSLRKKITIDKDTETVIQKNQVKNQYAGPVKKRHIKGDKPKIALICDVKG